MDRIIHAIDPDTGELLNPYQLVSAPPVVTVTAARPSIDAVLWQALPAIKALKFFTLTIRGFRKRERERVTHFVRGLADLSAYSQEEIDDWVHQLWCGDIYAYKDGDITEYRENLQAIPSALLPRCHRYARLIAHGSGRKPIDPLWLERIETEFNPEARLDKPAQFAPQGEATEKIFE